MHAPQASHLDPPDRIFLPELLAPWIGVLSANTGDVKVAHRVGRRVAQHPDFWSPWHRSTDELATIVIEVRVRDKDRVRGELLRKVVTQPDAACIRVDQDTAAPGGMDAKACMRDGLDRDLSRLQMKWGIGRDGSRRDRGAGRRELSWATKAGHGHHILAPWQTWIVPVERAG